MGAQNIRTSTHPPELNQSGERSPWAIKLGGMVPIRFSGDQSHHRDPRINYKATFRKYELEAMSAGAHGLVVNTA